MPIINVPIDDPREPGRTVLGWAWAEFIAIDAAAESVTIRSRIWHSAAAAYDPAAESFVRTYLVAGDDYRALVAANPQLWGAIAGLADGVLQAEMGGEVVPATLPEWAQPTE
jgi:hypothetical protein